jgi:hypothetical protein
MFDIRMRPAASSAGIVVIATIIGAGVAAADPKVTEVKLQNKSGVTLEVTITDGDATLKKKGPIQSVAGNDARSIGTVPDGTTLKWVATPKRDDDKNRFTGCKGDKKVSGSTDTIVIEEKNCSKSSATTAPKTDASSKKADNEKSGNGQGSGSAANAPPKTGTSSGQGSGSNKGTIKLENTMDDVVVVDVKLSDELDNPYNRTEISSIPSKKTIEVKPDFTKDKSGKFDITISFSCWKDGDGNKSIYSGGLLKYKGSGTTIQIEKTKNQKTKEDECRLKL